MKKYVVVMLLNACCIFVLPLSAQESESEDSREKEIADVVKNVSEAACRGDAAAVLNYFPHQRVNYDFKNRFEMPLREVIERKYKREPNDADVRTENRIMRKFWRAYIEEIEEDLSKGKKSRFCGVKIIKIHPTREQVEVKLSNGKTDIWYLAKYFDDYEPKQFRIDLTTDIKNTMDKHFPDFFYKESMYQDSE